MADEKGMEGRAFGWTRRSLLGAAPAMLLGGRTAAAEPFAGGLAAADSSLDPALVARALAALAAHSSRLWSRDVVGVVDFTLPSAVPRLHLIDVIAGRARTLLVAHGKGSDPDHVGQLQAFSNAIGSNATSEGAYLVGEGYDGLHGPSRRLAGLDATNSNAEERAIVIHSAWYVGTDILATQGRLGRSDGCFAVSPADIAEVLARLGRGRLLYAGRR